MNSIAVISPYQIAEGLWVFDDPARGLHAEAFVGGASEAIDAINHLAGVKGERCAMAFSAEKFPGHIASLEYVDQVNNGSMYSVDAATMQRLVDSGFRFPTHSTFAYNAPPGPENPMLAWLCPSLLLYFPDPPKRIYVQSKAAGDDPHALRCEA